MNSVPIAVCIIVEDLPVPFDRRVWQEARALAAAGYRVSVICRKSGPYRAGRETLDGIEIYRHAIFEASTPAEYLVEYTWALLAQWALALRVYGRTRFRVLHACNPPDTIFLVALFFKLLGVRFIFDHHDLNPELYEAKFGRKGFFYRLVALAERWTFRTADVSVATNESYREIAVRRGHMPPEDVFVVRSCPDLAALPAPHPDARLKRGHRFLVAYLGTMGPQDGINLLLDAVGAIASARDDTMFVLIGGGTEVERLKSMTTAKGLNGVVEFTGRIADDILAAYLSTADVCVAPDPKNAMNDKSTMNKILQYMAYARPVVLFDLTEGRRSAGEAALYARPNDPRDFATQILKLLDSESLRQQLGARGRRRIEESLNWDEEKQHLLAAYARALAVAL
ncbi:MAG TPA: glycosyltransferase family 4 protein [Terriglobia bacterium]|nr:glycosyltransferase family 4 protein [Terriglobia bacterium]